MNDSLVVELLVSGLLYGTPLVLAGLGELLAERGGVMNLGVEAMMLMGAVTAFWFSQSFEGPGWLALLLAILIAALVGMAISTVYAFVVVTLRANQVVSGLALLILGGATGLSSYVASVGELAGPSGRHRLQAYNLFGLSDAPVVGPLIFSQNILVYVSWGLVALAAFYLYRTQTGLHLQAVGEDPRSADAMGINVARYRYAHTVIGGALAGVAGAYYTLAIAPTWVDNVTAGAGWIAIALVITAFWRPGLLLAGAYLFGIVTSLGFTLQARGVDLPPEIFSSLPYVLTILAVVIVSSGWGRERFNAPAALGQPYTREEA
ncbi:MAG: ABC transporter permease [bacterium]|nr:ABC transporter permease [bacterium]